MRLPSDYDSTFHMKRFLDAVDLAPHLARRIAVGETYEFDCGLHRVKTIGRSTSEPNLKRIVGAAPLPYSQTSSWGMVPQIQVRFLATPFLRTSYPACRQSQGLPFRFRLPPPARLTSTARGLCGRGDVRRAWISKLNTTQNAAHRAHHIVSANTSATKRPENDVTNY